MRIGKIGALVLLLVLISGFYVAFMVPVMNNSPLYQAGRDFSTVIPATIFGVLGLVYRFKSFLY